MLFWRKNKILIQKYEKKNFFSKFSWRTIADNYQTRITHSFSDNNFKDLEEAKQYLFEFFIPDLEYVNVTMIGYYYEVKYKQRNYRTVPL